MALVLVDGNERVDLLHPVFIARLEAFAADPDMEGQVAIESAVRTYLEQTYLYQHQPPTAANPNRLSFTSAYGLDWLRGSWHMQQDDGRGYAIDLDLDRMSERVVNKIGKVAARYRLQQTVTRSGRVYSSPPPPNPATMTPPLDVLELWHLQPCMDEGPLVWIPPEAPLTPDQEKKLDKLTTSVSTLTKSVGTLVTRTDLLLDAVEGRDLEAPGAAPRTAPPLRRIVEAIAAKVGAKTG